MASHCWAEPGDQRIVISPPVQDSAVIAIFQFQLGDRMICRHFVPPVVLAISAMGLALVVGCSVYPC